MSLATVGNPFDFIAGIGTVLSLGAISYVDRVDRSLLFESYTIWESLRFYVTQQLFLECALLTFYFNNIINNNIII